MATATELREEVARRLLAEREALADEMVERIREGYRIPMRSIRPGLASAVRER